MWGVRSDFLCRRCYFRPSEAEISQALDGQDALALFLWVEKMFTDYPVVEKELFTSRIILWVERMMFICRIILWVEGMMCTDRIIMIKIRPSVAVKRTILNQGWARTRSRSGRFAGSWTRRSRVSSQASSVTEAKCSTGNRTSPERMFLQVASGETPRKGDRPLQKGSVSGTLRSRLPVIGKWSITKDRTRGTRN